MKIKYLNKRPDLAQKSRLNKKYLQFQELISELRDMVLNIEIKHSLNNAIDTMNSLSDFDKKLGKQLKSEQSKILKLLKNELKLVTKNYYRNKWLAFGIGALGVPIGIAIGVIMGNMAFIGIGLPIGFGFGLAVGTGLDLKVKEKGKQLKFEIKY
ncbi:hypothetical protein BST83_06855 [Polaribacter filamentus]|jgi:hypothetical protein|uniref:Glycine zipper family protein n=1 Tax=Polaribacter filamentus TaxID=53483 RepID=A0A2S7KW91_9FLAO|nr:hypothetical protein [Polaribacter filamentus]PQB06901.1 hypothetical protein BST83_06855 [Polaribacter filamentus]